MLSKAFLYILSFIFVLIMAIYLFISDSYKLSVEAKYYYTIEHYDMALELSKKSFELDRYNRMASTIMTQSQIAMLFVEYNQQAQKYLDQIAAIIEKEDVTRADKIKIKFICEIMIEKHKKISETVLTQHNLVAQSRAYLDEFKKLHEKVSLSLQK